jgi:hypothetical protein
VKWDVSSSARPHAQSLLSEQFVTHSSRSEMYYEWQKMAELCHPQKTEFDPECVRFRPARRSSDMVEGHRENPSRNGIAQSAKSNSFTE